MIRAAGLLALGTRQRHVGELLVLEATLGVLQRAGASGCAAAGSAKWHQSPSGRGHASSWGQGASVVPPASSAVGPRREDALVAGGRAGLDEHERVGRAAPRVARRSRRSPPGRARRGRRTRSRDPPARRRSAASARVQVARASGRRRRAASAPPAATISGSTSTSCTRPIAGQAATQPTTRSPARRRDRARRRAPSRAARPDAPERRRGGRVGRRCAGREIGGDVVRRSRGPRRSRARRRGRPPRAARPTASSRLRSSMPVEERLDRRRLRSGRAGSTGRRGVASFTRRA